MASRPTARRSDTVDRLVDAAESEVRDRGHEGLTVRNVARRAGVAPATAYTYFSSKDHLVAEVFWRRVARLPPVPADPVGPLRARLGGALAEVAMLVSDEPELAAACTQALLARDADVAGLRDRIGGAIHGRLSAAAGPDTDPGLVDVLDLVYSGAMLQAGTGHLSYDQLAERLATAVDRLVPDPPEAT